MEYQLKISGVHYGANGDSVAGQKDTEEMHMRTLEMLSWIDRERPIVVLSADPVNHIHKDAIKAGALGKRIGRVAYEDVDRAWNLLRQSGKPMMLAKVKEVAIQEHGYVVVTVSADELQAGQSASAKEIEWRQWLLKNDGKLWQGLKMIDSILRQLPANLYGDIGQLDVVLSRLYYLDTPRQAFQAILALLMLRHITCSQLGIDMHPMIEDEYQQDGLITNPMDMPTTIGRVVAFGETRCDRGQKQTIELLVHWLRDDYEQSHPQELDVLAEDSQQSQMVTMQNPTINGPIYGISGNSNVNLGG